MSFRSPWLLVGLLALPFIAAADASRRGHRSQQSVRLAAEGLVTTSDAARPKRRRYLPFVLFLTALAVLVVGLARPVTTIKTPRREATVLLAVDVSNSMAATDIKPSRLTAAKTAADAFVARQSSGVKIGVVSFGNGAIVVQTPTSAHAEAVRAIDRLSIGGGTSLGQGLLTSLDAIAGKQLTINEQDLANDAGKLDIGYYGSASVVMFSDGENVTGPNPVAMAQVASVAGVRVHTIGVGTPTGTAIQINGFSVATALNQPLLQQVATLTNGSYHSAGAAGGLAAVTRSIDLKFKIVSEHTEVTGLFAAAGVALLVLAAALSVLWVGRVV
jgi:Ca-activated chloride channel family protein